MEECQVYGPIFIGRLCKSLVLKALGHPVGVNRMWTKKNDHAPKTECADLFFNTCPKSALLKKLSSFDEHLSFVGLHLSTLLVKCVEDVACKSSRNNFYKKMSV
jgi:hypothetical protein